MRLQDDDAIAPPAALSKPRITARGIGVAAVCWVLYALFYATIIARTQAAPFAGVLIGQLISAALLALLSVPPWWLVVREMDRASWGWKGSAHLIIAPLYAFLALEAFLILTRLMAGPEVTATIRANYLWIFFSYVTVYFLQFALYHAVRFAERLRQREKQAAELRALAQERELAALKAQLNPHFLFNTLNSINAAVRKNPEEARAMLTELAGLLRHALDSSRDGALVPLRDELHFARRYLDLEAHRFSDRLDLRYEVDERALDTPVPPMTLQPLVENAVRHGIAPMEKGGTITLRIERSDDAPSDHPVRVSVEDTGAGINENLPEETLFEDGVGLQNTSLRLERVFGPEARLHTAPNTPRGFRVWFSIPENEDRGS